MLRQLVSQLNIQDIPILDLGDYVGHTGYIDFIKSKDMSSPIMRGIDCLRRPFLSIKVDCKRYPVPSYSEDTEEDPGEPEVRKTVHAQFVYTIFQRYTDDSQLITTATCYPSGYLFKDCGGIKENECNAYVTRINALLRGEQVKSYDPYTLTDDDLIEGNGDLWFTIESARQPIRDAVNQSDVVCKDIANLIVDLL